VSGAPAAEVAPAAPRADRPGIAGPSRTAVRLRGLVGTRTSGVLLVLLLLVLWEVSARLGWVQSTSWPPVSAILRSLVPALAGGELAGLLLSTLGRMAGGYAMGCGLGIVLGLLVGTNRWVRYAILPIVEVLRPIPTPAIVPPLILFLGVDDALKVFVVALASFFPVFINTFTGVQSVSDVQVETARTFRVGWRRTVLEVVLPATLPSIAAGLRVAIGLSLVVTVIAEMIAGSSGIGYYIVQMQYAMRPEAMYGAVICLALIGYALNRLFLALERRMIPWMGHG
jgi:ABC-type nitrate/sulfonate/bicarbonate transport system permease component